MIRRTEPDLVVALWGLWDLYDADVNGTRLVVGTPEWTAFMQATLNRALDKLTARGARVVILTTPYLDTAPDRVDTLNTMFRTLGAPPRGGVDINRRNDLPGSNGGTACTSPLTPHSSAGSSSPRSRAAGRPNTPDTPGMPAWTFARRNGMGLSSGNRLALTEGTTAPGEHALI
jgi:hypothetical protein